MRLSRGHDLAHRSVRIGLEADVAVGEDADQPAAVFLDHGDAGDSVLLLEAERFAHRAVGRDGQRVDHHAGLEFLDPADLLRLGFGRHILVDDAEAACLRHGDGEPAFGHRVHGGRNQRDAEADFVGDLGIDGGLSRQHRRGRRDQRHVVEGERLSNLHRDPCRVGAHYTQIAEAAKHPGAGGGGGGRRLRAAEGSRSGPRPRPGRNRRTRPTQRWRGRAPC